MTREEMMAAGLVPEETKHNGHRRAHFHDYNRPGVYMITMVTEGRQRLFGQIAGQTGSTVQRKSTFPLFERFGTGHL